MLLGAFFPLVLVIGFGLLVGIAVIVRETRLLVRGHKTDGSKTFESLTSKHLSVKSNGIYYSDDHGILEEHKFKNKAETNRLELLERESDNEWLSEIANKLDPSSPEEAELLNTATTMLKHANYTMLHSTGTSDRLKYIEGQQQKELSKRFIERKLVELKSAK